MLWGLISADFLASLSPLSSAVKNNQGLADISIRVEYKNPCDFSMSFIIASFGLFDPSISCTKL